MNAKDAIRREALLELLRAFVREAGKLDAHPDETLAAMMEMSGRVYSVGVSGAIDQREEKAAHKLFTTAAARMMRGLPTATRDTEYELRLIAGGHHDRTS